MGLQLLPTPCELAKAATLGWLRVGCEGLGLVAYMLGCNIEEPEALEEVRTTMTEPQEGDLRVYHIQNPPAPATWYDVSNPGEGFGKIMALAAKDLRNPDIWGNVFGLTVFEDGEWVDWYDDDGGDIDAWAEKKGVTA
jgi:hypothetical protein